VREARCMRLIPWTLQSGSEQILLALQFLFGLQAKCDGKKIRELSLLVLRMCLALPKGTTKVPCFAYKRRVQLRAKYCSNTIATMSWVPLNLHFQNSPINYVVLNGYRNKENIR
jgi:hypothetical protein